MSERTKLWGAVALVVVVAGVAVWRIRAALRETAGETAAHHSAADVDYWVRSEVERSVPGVHPPEAWGLDAVPRGPHLRLGTLHIHSDLAGLHAVMARKDRQFKPAYTAVLRMGGNAWVKERIDEEVPGLPPGQGEMVEAVYLLHAGEVPADLRPALDGWACEVTEVVPGSAAEQCGLEEGDVLLQVNGGRQWEHSGDDRCSEVVDALTALGPNQPAALEVLRSGERVELTMQRPGTRFGFLDMQVPVLERF